MLACAEKFEDKLAAALKAQGYTMKRAHKIDEARGHGLSVVSVKVAICLRLSILMHPLLCY